MTDRFAIGDTVMVVVGGPEGEVDDVGIIVDAKKNGDDWLVEFPPTNDPKDHPAVRDKSFHRSYMESHLMLIPTSPGVLEEGYFD